MTATPITRGRKVCETIHQMSAGLWFGSLIMAAATAGILFGTMRSLEPSLGRFAAYAGPHSDLGAGFIQNRVFLAADAVQFIGAMGTLASSVMMIAFFGLPLRRISTGVRLAALGAAMILVSFQFFVLAPRMQQHSGEYWRAAEAGQMDAAHAAYDAFIADHPTARNVMAGTTLAVAVLLGAGAWSGASAGEPERRGPERPRPAGGLETPRLARGNRA